MAKIDQKILKAVQLKGQMNELEEKSPQVQRYLNLEKERKSLHRDITAHIEQYPHINQDRPHLVTRTGESISISAIREFFQQVRKGQISTLEDAVEFIQGSVKEYFTAYTR